MRITKQLIRRFSSTPDIPSFKQLDLIASMRSQVVEHSLLPSLFIYPFYENNYGYLLHDQTTQSLVMFDCGDFKSSLKNLKQVEKQTGAQLQNLFLTHEHDDHIGGALRLKQEIPSLKIQTGSSAQKNGTMVFADKYLQDNEIVQIGSLCIACLFTPGHTKSHVSYLVTQVTPTSTKTPFLFCGDTLFIGGCGRIFDGTAEELFGSLRLLRSMPNETMIFCAHEYAINNLQFTLMIDPQNPFVKTKLQWAKEMRAKDEVTVGGLMAEEKLYNPFLRADQKYFLELTDEKDPVRSFAKIRKMKDQFT